MHWPIVGSLLGQRRRRWPINDPTMGCVGRDIRSRAIIDPTKFISSCPFYSSLTVPF